MSGQLKVTETIGRLSNGTTFGPKVVPFDSLPVVFMILLKKLGN